MHDLRHSFVATLLASGVSLPEAAALARHANPRVTAAVYAGLTEQSREQLAASCRRLSEAASLRIGTAQIVRHVTFSVVPELCPLGAPRRKETSMRTRRIALLGVVAAAALGATAPTQAINDPRVPANECAADPAAAVGDPLAPGNPGINFHTPLVSPPVSLNNPGQSTGAKGQLMSSAIGKCPNSLA